MKDLITDICERMDSLRRRHGTVFRNSSPAAPPLIPLAEALAFGLEASDPEAVRIGRALVDRTETGRAQLWASPFGRLLFQAGGYEGETLPQAHAAALLGCSRQWVNTLVARGELGVQGDGSAKPGSRPVLVSHVQAFMKAKVDMSVNLL